MSVTATVRAKNGEVFWGWRDVGFVWVISIVASIPMTVLMAVLMATTTSRAPLYSISLPAFGVIFWALRARFRRKYDRPLWRSLGWVRPKLKVQTAVLLGQLLAVSVALGGGMLALTELRTFARGLLADPVAFWFGFLPWSSVGPVCEELFYRGFLQPVLVRSWGAAAGIGFCALLLSGTNLALLGLPPQTLLLNVLVSVAFGIVRHKTGSTMVVAISHAAYNATFFFGALLLELLAG
jgi:hypothetical protein